MALSAAQEGQAEASAWARHRAGQSLALDEGASEARAFARARERHRRPVSFGEIPADIIVTHPKPHVPSEDSAPGIDTKPTHELPVAHQLAAWAKSVVILDASEVLVRDVIERELSHPEFLLTPDAVNRVIERTMAAIIDIRTTAIKTAFLLVRDRLGDKAILEMSMSKWAATFLRMDLKQIEMAIRAAVVEGLDGQEIARKVVGTMGLNGVDGVTEFTRLKVAHLGRAAIRESNLRKRGQGD